jgi:surfeit locus 1 family protein
MTVGALLLFVSFIALGRWQWGRAEQKQELWDAFARSADAARTPDERPLEAWPRYQHVKLTGSWQPARQFLLDNRIVDSAAGYETLTPFELSDGRLLLVNRGWLRFNGHREQLPDVSMAPAAGAVTIQGRLDNLPSPGLASGRAAPPLTGAWPRLTSYPSMSELGAALGARLETRIVLLDANEPQGYVRRWQPPGVSPDTHWSYAIQWWCFAALLLVLFVTLNTRRLPSP